MVTEKESYMDTNNCITEEQQKKMLHAIGFDHNLPRKNQKQYHAYRNRYAASASCISAWQDLIRKGFAVQDGTSGTLTYYHVTKNGLDCLEKILHMEIVESEP